MTSCGLRLDQHGEAGLAAGHNVGMVAEDVQGRGWQTVRAETWNTQGSCSAAILYIFGIISSRP